MKDAPNQRWDRASRQIAVRGVRSHKALSAMRLIPCPKFLPAHLRASACADLPVLIAGGRTLIRSYVAACMIEALGLTGGEKVREIGMGAGCVAADL